MKMDQSMQLSDEKKQAIHRKMELITKDLIETIGMDEVRNKLEDGKQLTVYWGTEPTRSPSLGYLIPMLKLRDLVQADLNVIVFLADVHAYLNKGLGAIDRTTERTNYYAFLIEVMLDRLGVQKQPSDIAPANYEFVKGRKVQLDSRYILDLYKFMTLITINQARKSGSEVVKQDKDPKVSSLVYPLMQVLDETILQADIQLGGLDQRKIFALSRDMVEQMGYQKCAYMMNPLLPSLGKPGTKMSSSDVMGKIDFTDTKEQIVEKIKKAYCVEKEVDLERSPCLAFAKYIVFSILGKLGVYDNFAQLLLDWESGKLCAVDFKEMLSIAVNEVVAPIRTAIEENKQLYDEAYGE